MLILLVVGVAVGVSLLLALPPERGLDPLDFQRLVGRWNRSEDPYVLVVQSVAADGQAVVRYFNPDRQIRVAQARATREGNQLQLFVELRDEGYPGSTYTLTYDPQRVVLMGKYVMGESKEEYPVEFIPEK